MNSKIMDRVILESNLIIGENYTIREVAEFIKKSKSTVHKDLNVYLPLIDVLKYYDVKKILQKHFDNKHIKGGSVTKEKYTNLKKRVYYEKQYNLLTN